jgi:NMD protein affecting ribosome stability and mRNA decay
MCPDCGRSFEAIKVQVYHSRACQVRAYRRRKREAERQKVE